LFLKPQTLSKLYTPTSYYPDEKTGKNYHGFWTELYLAGHVIGHGGNTIGMSAMLHIDIENNLGAVIMTNQANEQVYNRKMSTLIFGTSDFSQIDNSANDVNASGTFKGARTFQKGMFRLHALMGNTMPSFQRNNDIISIPMFGEIHRVAPGVYLSSDESMLSNMVFFITSNEAGDAEIISMMFSDYFRMSWWLVIFEIFITLLLFISGIYGLVVLIRLLINKARKREQSFSVLRAGVTASLLLLTVNLAVIVITALSLSLTMPVATILGIVHILLTLTAVTCVVMLLLKIRTPNLSKKQKRQILTPVIMCAFILINTIYWQFWVFWL